MLKKPRISGVRVASSPGPTQKSERGLVTLANYLVCAESAYYVTITCLLRSRGSQLLLTMALQSRWADLATEQPQGNPVRQEQQPSKHKYAISFWNSRFTKSLLALFPFLSGLGTSLLPSRVKNVVNWQWTNVIPLLQTKTADTAHTGIFASVTRPSPQFLGGAWGRG